MAECAPKTAHSHGWPDYCSATAGDVLREGSAAALATERAATSTAGIDDITFGRGADEGLVCWSNCVGCKSTRRWGAAYIFSLYGGAVAWSSKVQTVCAYCRGRHHVPRCARERLAAPSLPPSGG